jgi:hypothetical protein
MPRLTYRNYLTLRAFKGLYHSDTAVTNVAAVFSSQGKVLKLLSKIRSHRLFKQ